jgi:CheY-like chemotaxis protein
MPSSKLLLHAAELRARAEEILVQAATFQDADAQRKMFEVAATYEKLAQRIEQGAANPGDSPPRLESRSLEGGAPANTHQLAGKRILIVEDERTIAENLAFEIAAQGGEVVGPVATTDAALDAIAIAHLDGATVDIKLMDKMTFSVADVLAHRQIPFLFVTGYGPQIVPARHTNVRRLAKPVTPIIVCRALEGAMSDAP